VLAWFLAYFLPVGCLVLGNLLIAGEFRQRTQLFLEALPIERWQMLAVKYVYGLSVVLMAAFLMLARSFVSSYGAEAMTMRFAFLLCFKTLLWSWFLWSASFAHAFLGRYRILIGIVLVFGLRWIDEGLGFELNRFGPFELIGDRFSYERMECPWEAVGITVVLIVALTALGFMLGMVRDASVASMLSEKMSSRERMVIISLTLVGLMLAGSSLERASKTDSLQMPGAEDVSLRAATVSAAAAVSVPTHDEKRLLTQHADAAAQLISSAADYLNCPKLPTLFMVHRRDMSSGELEDGELDSRQGYLVRLNMSLTSPDDRGLQCRILSRVLSANQHYRLDSDSRSWILEGFAAWWPVRNQATSPADLTRIYNHSEKCRTVSIVGLDLSRWLVFAKELDDENLVATVAGVGVLTLGKNGIESQRRFLSKVLGYSPPHDFRATLHDAWYTVPAVLKATTKSDVTAFASQWTKALYEEPLPNGDVSP